MDKVCKVSNDAVQDFAVSRYQIFDRLFESSDAEYKQQW